MDELKMIDNSFGAKQKILNIVLFLFLGMEMKLGPVQRFSVAPYFVVSMDHVSKSPLNILHL